MNSDKSSPIIPTPSVLIHFDLVRGLDRAMYWALIHEDDVGYARRLLRLGYKTNNIDSRLPPIQLRHPIIECDCGPFPTHSCGFNSVSHRYEVDPCLVIHAVNNDHMDLLSLLVEEEQRQLPKTIPLVLVRESRREKLDKYITPFHLARGGNMIRALRQIDPELSIDDQNTTQSEPLLI